MGVKKNVFASKSERENFYALERIWASSYRLYHNLPFLNVFDTSKLIDYLNSPNLLPLKIDEIDLNRLKKTSIDFTLCDDDDCPIVCVEFDGLQDGFNVGDKYYPGTQYLETSLWRRKITELKLKVARGSSFPFFVVGYKQFSNISKETQLTIVDGIIGEVIALRKVNLEVQNFSFENLPISEEDFNLLSSVEQQEYIQTWLSDLEVEMDFENNPIVKKRWQLESELAVNGFSIIPLAYPPFEPGDIEGFKGIILIGDKVTYKTDDLGEIEGEAWLPNFNMPGFSGFGLTEDIAALYALEKIKELRKNKN